MQFKSTGKEILKNVGCHGNQCTVAAALDSVQLTFGRYCSHMYFNFVLHLFLFTEISVKVCRTLQALHARVANWIHFEEIFVYVCKMNDLIQLSLPPPFPVFFEPAKWQENCHLKHVFQVSQLNKQSLLESFLLFVCTFVNNVNAAQEKLKKCTGKSKSELILTLQYITATVNPSYYQDYWT